MTWDDAYGGVWRAVDEYNRKREPVKKKEEEKKKKKKKKKKGKEIEREREREKRATGILGS